MKYMVVVEEAEANFSAYVPDLPGCIATGDTREETIQQIKEAIEFHIEGMLEAGEVVPSPKTDSEYVDVSAA